MSDKASVRIGGVVAKVQLKMTKKGDRMAFLTVEDLTGLVEILVFPDLYQACQEHLVQDAPVLVSGEIVLGGKRWKSHRQDQGQGDPSAGIGPGENGPGSGLLPDRHGAGPPGVAPFEKDRGNPPRFDPGRVEDKRPRQRGRPCSNSMAE